MKRKFLFTLIALFAILGTLPAQKVNVEQLKGLKIRSIGPAGMSGRITAIAADPSNTAIIYAGSASGGLWKSVDGGIYWEPIFDKQPTQSIGAIAVCESNPQEIWVGTGEGNPRNSINTGLGIFKSLDGGKTWQNMGLKETKTIHRVIIHRDNPNVVLAGALGSPFGPNDERGIYKTTDGGKTWKKVLFVNNQTGCADLVVDPTNPNKLIAAMWEYGRKPWTFSSGGKGSGLYVSYDGGETWTKRTSEDGLPEGELGRIGLAIAPSKPNIVYALVEAKDNALFKSTDGGIKWAKANTNERNVSERPFYYHELYVDPKNENRIFNLYSEVSVSQDGGKTFDIFERVSHSDHHAFWIDPNNPNYMLLGSDGGLYISRDGGAKWMFAENIPVGQFYHVNYDMDYPYNIGGGMQDNGSWVGPNTAWKQGGILNYDWQEVFFGDGFDLGFRPDDNRYVYAMSQGGNLGYVDRQTGRSKFIRPVHPTGVELRFNWNAAFAQNPQHPGGIYYGSQFIHKSMDFGQTWEIISPDLTTDDKVKQQGAKETGGLTPDVTNAENHTTILAILPSSVDEKVIWASTDDGNLQLTRDGGKTWTNLASKLPTVKAGSWIPAIEVSNKNAGEAFVVVNDYRRNDWRPMVFHTNNYGQTFTRIVDENKVSGYAMTIVQDPVEPKLLWLGTDEGLWFSIDMGANWNHWMNDFPAVPVADLKIHPREHDLIVATFGRSFWILDDIRPFRELVKTKGETTKAPFRVFDVADAYQANYRSYSGTHFITDDIYSGQSKARGAAITLWATKLPKSKTDSTATASVQPALPPQGGSGGGGGGFGGFGGGGGNTRSGSAGRAKVMVYTDQGTLIRTFNSPIDTGLNRIYWDMRSDGIRFPSRTEARPDADLPGGAEVLPGKYKVVVNYGTYKDSTMLTVHGDPRIQISASDRQAKVAALEDFYKMASTATTAFNRVREAQKTIKTVSDAMSNAPEASKKELTKMGKTLQDSLTKLELLFVDAENLKGISRNSENLSSTMFRVPAYINAGDGAPTQSAKIMLDAAKKQLNEVLMSVNNFFSKDFASYQQKVEATQFSLFKKYEPIKMK